MTDEQRRKMKIDAGHECLRRAYAAVESGQYAGFNIYVTESDPEVIDHIRFVRHCHQIG